MRKHHRDRPRSLVQCLLLFCLSLLAPPLLAGPVLVLTEHFQKANLGEYFEYLEDPGHQFTLAEVQSEPLQSRFGTRDSQLNLGYTHSAWWLRFTVQNPGKERELLLALNQPSLKRITFYAPDPAGNYQPREAGGYSEHIVGDIPTNHYWLNVQVPAESQMVMYLRLESDMALTANIWLGSATAIGLANDADSTWFGVGVGILTGLALYNLLLLRNIRRDRSNLFYAAYLFSILFYLLVARGTLGVLYWRLPGIQNLLLVVTIHLSLINAMLFTSSFLQSPAFSTRLHRLLKWFSLLLVTSLLVSFFLHPTHAIRMAMLFALLVPATMMLASAHAARHGYGPARYMVAGCALVLACIGLVGLNMVGLIMLPWSAGTMVLLAVCLEAIILAIGLTARLQLMHREAAQEKEKIAVTEAEARAKGSFLAQVSHEIRTPMSGILGMTELLLDTPLTPNQREYAHTIHASSNSLLRILNDILDYSKMEAGKLSVVEEDFDLNELLNDCLDLFKGHAEEKHLELIASIDARVPSLVTGDPTRLRQVISNILRNAIKFTQNGEVVVSVTPASVGGDNGIRVEVSDTGIGIPPAQLASIFQPYQQGSNNTRPETGTGLGLSICRQLVELMGGSIGVESREREGSRFWFELPVRARAGDTPPVLVNEHKLRGLRLLMVDDNHTVNRVIQQQAGNWGVLVTTADNGAAALAMARNAANLGEPFDIIVADNNMPGMSGLQLAARIKEDPLIRNDVVVIMLTGTNNAPTSTMARNVGIRRVLTKPVTERQLKTALVEELGHVEKLRHEAPAATDTDALRQLHVLIAEDNHLSQKVIRGMLGKLGVNATVVANGKEVVEEVSRHHYDMVLMDCDMPFMDGYVATEAIRQWEHSTGRKPIPILALTAHILDEHREKSRAAGMNAHLSKPIEMAELQAALLYWSRIGKDKA